MANLRTIADEDTSSVYPNVRKIAPSDLKEVLSKGIADFLAMPSHLFFLGLIYPIVGIWLVVGNSLELLVPLVSGFALVGPLAALGFYEISRRRELGLLGISHEYGIDPAWKHAFSVIRSHSIFSILSLGMLLLVILTCWLFTAQALYMSFFGSEPPESFTRFISDVLTTSQGWKLIGYGTGIGFVFAVVAFSISAVSFPLLLEHDVEAPVAIFTSVRVVLKNPLTMALWGLIVAFSLVAGTVLLFAGLAVVVPVLGHATWHLYRKTIEPAPGLMPNSPTISDQEISAVYPTVYPDVRKITPSDLKEVLSKGIADFKAMPSHLFFLGLIYPIAGIWLVFGNSLELLVPLVSGFALVGPLAALGFYEVSRRRELGLLGTSHEYGIDASWKDAFSVIRSHSVFSLLSLGMLLLVIFTCWIFTAQGLYTLFFGSEPPESFTRFIGEVFTTSQGWNLIGYGTGIGFVFAMVAFSISAVSFPLLLDRDVEAPVAIFTSVRVVLKNPLTMALWGLIVAFSLAAGTLLLFAGLAVVVPVLGHATWHLYRKAVDTSALR
jgi:uncharacterized membrane protein